MFECLVKAKVDGLPGGRAAGYSLNLGGQVVETWRSVKAFLTDGGEQIDNINLSGRALGEFQVLGQLAKVGFGEDHGADGKLF